MAARQDWKETALGCLIVFGSALLVLVVLPISFIAFAFWAAEGSWDFEGRGFRYWMFVKGSRLERLGFVSPAEGPPRYSVRLQEGTFPGWRVLTYRSTALPDAIVASYAERCRAMGLKITRGPEPKTYEDDESGSVLVCEIQPYLDAEFYAGRKPSDPSSQVNIRVWGDE